MDLDGQRYSEEQLDDLLQHTLDCHEFHVYLQPKYELSSMKIVAAEALIRWMSAIGGFLCPDDFIPYLERTGFIVRSDFFVLEEVCKKIRGWLDGGVQPTLLSVNQSGAHMLDEYYIERIHEVIQKYRIPARLIELEITESMFLSDSGKLIEIMRQLRALGFVLSIDDFGAGYSSLNLLNRIPADILKLDKVFLNDVEKRKRSRIVISQVVEMAHKLGMKVVCEGVEKESQAKFLRDIACDMAQGFLFAEPMPMDAFDAFRNA